MKKITVHTMFIALSIECCIFVVVDTALLMGGVIPDHNRDTAYYIGVGIWIAMVLCLLGSLYTSNSDTLWDE